MRGKTGSFFHPRMIVPRLIEISKFQHFKSCSANFFYISMPVDAIITWWRIEMIIVQEKSTNTGPANKYNLIH
jgi:hypothetical protein